MTTTRRRRPHAKDKRTIQIVIKVNAAELALIDAGADAAGLTRGAYLAKLGTGGAPERPG